MLQIEMTRFGAIGASALLMLVFTCPALAAESPAPFDPMQSLLSEAASVSTAVANPSEVIEKRKKAIRNSRRRMSVISTVAGII